MGCVNNLALCFIRAQLTFKLRPSYHQWSQSKFWGQPVLDNFTHPVKLFHSTCLCTLPVSLTTCIQVLRYKLWLTEFETSSAQYKPIAMSRGKIVQETFCSYGRNRRQFLLWYAVPFGSILLLPLVQKVSVCCIRCLLTMIWRSGKCFCIGSDPFQDTMRNVRMLMPFTV